VFIRVHPCSSVANNGFMRVRMKGEERRAAIVHEAIRLFAQHGFHGTTTRKLAAALGVTEPVLYQHFPSKNDLYTAIIEAKTGEVQPDAGRLRELARGSDDRAFLCGLGELMLRRYEEDPELSRLLFFSALEGHELADLFFERLYIRFYQIVTRYIRRRIREGAFRKVNPEIAARGLIGMISYHGQIGILYPGKFKRRNPKEIATQMVETYLHGIYRPDEPNPPAPLDDSASVPSIHSTDS
jgi:AcrR family transcriptional regulator